MKMRLTTAVLGACLLGWLLSSPPILTAAKQAKTILYWVAPMDPNYRRDKPGKSPMGMDLVPVYADEAGGGNTVVIDPDVVENLGVRTARVERGRLRRIIDTVGYVDYDESKQSHIHLRTEGWIERLYFKSEGEQVRKGERLFDLYSPELVNAQQEYLQALKTGNEDLVQASQERLTALGVSGDQVRQIRRTRHARQIISFYAPQDGVIATLPVSEGMYVKPETRVMSLADLSSVWLLAEVFERQADWVKVGQNAEVRLSYLPGRTWKGRVEYIYPSLDPVTRTLKARLRFDNPEETLKPNMFANVKIFGVPTREAIVIPVEALIRTGREDRVIVALGKGHFAARSVTAGVESDGRVEILAGLHAGEAVVVSGQFLIDSESSFRAGMQRMNGSQSDAAKVQP